MVLRGRSKGIVGLYSRSLLEGMWGPLWDPFPYPPLSQRKEDEDELSYAGSEEASMLSEFADDAHGEGAGIVGEKSCED